MAATEDPLPAFEFVGTPLDFSDSELLKLEAMLDAREELERMSSALKVYEEETPSLSSSEPEEEKEEDRSVAVGRASPESESSAGARIQQHDSQTSIINNNNTKKEEDVYYREFVRIIRVAAEVIVILIVTISVLNGAFTSPPSEVFARQQLGQDAPMRAFPTGLQISCPPVQSSCYVFEILDLHDLTTVNSRAEEENGEMNELNLMEEREMQQTDAATQQWQNANSQQIIDQPQGSEPSMFRVILSTASGQVHHIAFAFVNIPLVHGCALRRLR